MMMAFTSYDATLDAIHQGSQSSCHREDEDLSQQPIPKIWASAYFVKMGGIKGEGAGCNSGRAHDGDAMVG